MKLRVCAQFLWHSLVLELYSATSSRNIEPSLGLVSPPESMLEEAVAFPEFSFETLPGLHVEEAAEADDELVSQPMNASLQSTAAADIRNSMLAVWAFSVSR